MGLFRHEKGRAFRAVTVCLTALVVSTHAAMAGESCLRGINLSGAEFGRIGGVANKDYAYPSSETIRYFSQKGFNTVRLPFKWERLQPKLNGTFNADELARLDQSVKTIEADGMRVILDPHDYGRYDDRPIGGPDVPVAAFADFWGRLARHYAGDPSMIFGLMNEPHDMPASQWLKAVNAALSAIRAAKADNLVLVPGVAWTGAHSWQSEAYGGANATVMLGVKDEAQHYAYEVHQYFDRDFSGTSPDCSRADDAVKAIGQMTDWLRQNKVHGFLGEFGASAAPACVAAIKAMAGVVEDNHEQWIGWAYWVAGDWWPPSEPLNIQPTASGDRPQLQGLKPYLEDFSAASSDCPSLR
ncbi:glycoside hydrolase family 5 protein [Allorhizobium sp. BGMRC 0089]|uniref:glycoside hydrolase family 5 protein n=1 Tax=Allorhizobium sonneratiae TaxID=2934936 RepID=UPI00203446D5|nr:glycoside hydrolase family 5 protein [Allorhizobium sonneratiae]MCM2294738.1 glycoside hydrolase family 5 protein [Allorhizobium sonneratiae]